MTPPDLKLSICIGTFNRAAFIGETLESIISQATSDCEIVVSDNASTDNTQQVVSQYAQRLDRIRYIRQEKNVGIDRNFDRAVDLARGEYCWLFPDDDIMKPHAVARVLEALPQKFSLIILNVESRDSSMSKVVQRRWLKRETDRVYGPDEMDRLFLELDDASRTYIGNSIFKREIWLDRDRQRYYDSLFIHVGTIFQERLPGATLVVAEPLVSYRLGNVQSWSQQGIEIVLNKWPRVVESLALSDSARRRVASAVPWKNPCWLLFLRGWGRYSMIEYRRWIRPRLSSNSAKLTYALIALLPGSLVNLIFVFYYSARQDRGHLLHLISQSRFHHRNWRFHKSGVE